MLTPTSADLAAVPALRGNWVAVDSAPQRVSRVTRYVTLRSGAIVVDADEDLDVLCRRLKAERRTSLTIVFAQ